MIEDKTNYEEVFFRNVTVCLLATLKDKVKWVNQFTDKTVPVTVPFYYSLSGDNRFVMDAFTDDIISDVRKVSVNTDVIPRGHITLKSHSVKSDEFANPNIWLRKIVEHEDEIKRVMAKVRAIPMRLTYDLSIILASEIDVFKCSQAMLNTLWLYKYMYFEYNYLNIDAYFEVPDDSEIKINRTPSIDNTDNQIILTSTIEVHTYYPAYTTPDISPLGPNWYLRTHVKNS